MKLNNLDLSLIRKNIYVNRNAKNINYSRVNCYAYALNISISPEEFGKKYNIGCFCGNSSINLHKNIVFQKIESDFEVLEISFRRTFPIFCLKKDNSWKIAIFTKKEELWPFEKLKDVHFVKLQDNCISHKRGYKNSVEQSTSFKRIKKDLKQKGYKYVKSYKLKLK